MNRNLLYVIIAVAVLGVLALILIPSRQTAKPVSAADHVHDTTVEAPGNYQN